MKLNTLYRHNFWAGALALWLALWLVGCNKPKAMLMDSYQELLATAYQVQEGKELSLTVALPSETATAAPPVCSDGLSAAYTAPDLVISGLTAGAQTVAITFSDEGFEDGILTIPVEVTPEPPPQLEVALVSELLGLNAPVKADTPLDMVLYYGQIGQMQVFSSQPGVQLAFDADPAFLDCRTQGNNLTLTPLQPGSTTLTVTASLEGHLDAKAVCSIEVRAPADRTGQELADLQVTPPTVGNDAALEPLAQAILSAANTHRETAGLPALAHEPRLDPASYTRAKEASASWSHTRPDGRQSFSVYEDFQLGPFATSGENLSCADFQETGEEVAARWMASDMGHREAILHPSFTHTSVGVYLKDGMYYYCMLFVEQ